MLDDFSQSIPAMKWKLAWTVRFGEWVGRLNPIYQWLVLRARSFHAKRGKLD
jgi:hypothetical protein